MGLAVVHGIVQENGGAIRVESEPGQGALFRLLFPLLEALTGAEAEMPGPLPFGQERILLVDDEPKVAEIGQRMLEHLQYRVTVATCSPEALAAFRQRPEAFDLVVTDMTMPGMTGAELAADLLRIRAGLPVILCTGYSDRITEAEASRIGVRALMMKPLVLRDLAETVRRVLDR